MMKLNKLCAALLSGLLTCSAVTAVKPETGWFPSGSTAITAEAASTLRRPCDPEHPMLIVHIDTFRFRFTGTIISGGWCRTVTNAQNHG